MEDFESGVDLINDQCGTSPPALPPPALGIFPLKLLELFSTDEWLDD